MLLVNEGKKRILEKQTKKVLFPSCSEHSVKATRCFGYELKHKHFKLCFAHTHKLTQGRSFPSKVDFQKINQMFVSMVVDQQKSGRGQCYHFGRGCRVKGQTVKMYFILSDEVLFNDITMLLN